MKIRMPFALGPAFICAALTSLALAGPALADPAVAEPAVDDSAANSGDTAPAIAVTVVPVKHETLIQPIKNSGRVSQKSEARLAFKTSGLIENIFVEEGDFVKAGQILATLDLQEINAQQSRAVSNHKTAMADLERFNKLYQDSLVSLQIKQSAQSVADNAEAEL